MERPWSGSWADRVVNREVYTAPVSSGVVVLFRGGKSTASCRTGDRAREAERCEPEVIIVACAGYEYGRGGCIGECACPIPVERC